MWLTEEQQRALWAAIPESGQYREDALTWDAVSALARDGIIPNEWTAYRVIEVWCDIGLYDFGVSLRTGWREDGAEFRLVSESEWNADETDAALTREA